MGRLILTVVMVFAVLLLVRLLRGRHEDEGEAGG